MQEKIKQLLFDVLEIDSGDVKLEKDTNLIELGLDSLKAIELVVLLEDGFDISISDEDLLVDNLATIEDIVDLISPYIESNGG